MLLNRLYTSTELSKIILNEMFLNSEKNLVMRERANMVAQSLTVLFLSKEP